LAGGRGLVVTKSEVRVDGTSVGVAPAQIATDRAAVVAAIAAAVRRRPGEPFALSYTDDAAAPAVLDAVGALNAAGAAFTIHNLVDDRPHPLCALAAAAAPGPDDGLVQLSITIGAGRWRVAVSRIDDVVDATSIAQVASKLRDLKSSAFFVDRADLELAAAPGTAGAELTPVLDALCAAGFREVRPRPPGEVAAPLAVPTVSFGQPTVLGDLDQVIIRRYLKREHDKLVACFDRARKTKPALGGTVTARFVIDASGRVTTSAATGVDPALAACVAGVIEAIEFQRPASDNVRVEYPFDFRPPAP
jgi:hypothetical protein